MSASSEKTPGVLDRRMMRLSMKLIDRLFILSKLPGARFHPWLRPDKTDMRWLPINQDIELPESSPMPLSLLDRIIEEASHRALYSYCGCRAAHRCKSYPVEAGCLLMGDSARESSVSSSREVSVSEAKEAARRAVDAGLVPVIGKARVDNALFGIPDRGRMLTVCFCCECCCITRFARHTPLKLLEPLFPCLDGIAVEVGEDCSGCGICARHCYIDAISVEGGRAVISEYCRACGRCATVCPGDNITVRIDDPDFLEKAYERIRAHVMFD